MGRVEDAMRRAAEGGDERVTSMLATEDEVDALADEPFPVELRPRSTRPAPAATPDADAPVVPVAPAAPGPSSRVSEVHPASAASHADTVSPATAASHAGAARLDELRSHESVPNLHPRLLDKVDARLSGKLVPDQTMPSGVREQYRRLAATLHHAQVDHGVKVVMIASAAASEGKTLTATNLALTLSESYQRSVLLIDADLRRPSVHTVFKIDGAPGLSDGLMAIDQRRLPLHQVSERLTILPAGRPSSDPMAGLTSGRMKRLIQEAREGFDWVIIDTPPVGLMTDANLLAAMADGAILVVKAGATPYQLVQRAVNAIGRERLLGAVLNRTVGGAMNGHKYYDYYYGHDPRPKRKAWFRRSDA